MQLASEVVSSANAENNDLRAEIAQLQAKIGMLQAQIDAHEAEREATVKHLETFDELDLIAFNRRDMTRIKQIHADDVKVYNPDGTITKPMEPHAEELQYLFDTFDFRGSGTYCRIWLW